MEADRVRRRLVKYDAGASPPGLSFIELAVGRRRGGKLWFLLALTYSRRWRIRIRSGVARLIANPPSSRLHNAPRNQGAFPLPAFTELIGTTRLSATSAHPKPEAPGPPERTLPVLRGPLSLPACHLHYPGETLRAPSGPSPERNGLPR